MSASGLILKIPAQPTRCKNAPKLSLGAFLLFTYLFSAALPALDLDFAAFDKKDGTASMSWETSRLFQDRVDWAGNLNNTKELWQSCTLQA